MGAYDEDRLELVPHPADGMAKISNCNSAENPRRGNELGYARFSAGGLAPGCNPILGECVPAVPVQKVTWGGIKTLLK